MINHIRLTLEIGPKGKKVAAVAPDWPGLERGAKTEEEAVERLRVYFLRYSQVAKLAEMNAEFDAIQNVDVVEQYPGTGSTDFWGISFAFSSIDKQAMSDDELEREMKLMQACWAFFDDVRGRVSAEMRKGPRGGGRDRDRIVRHTLAAEQDWAKGVGVAMEVVTSDGVVGMDEEVKAYRAAYCQAIRDYHSQGKMAGNVAKWPLRFLIRHTAFHTMDHAWEMEDKDLTGKEA